MRAILVLLLVLAAAGGFFFVLNQDDSPTPGTPGSVGLTNAEPQPEKPAEVPSAAILTPPEKLRTPVEVRDAKVPDVAPNFLAGPDTGSGQVAGTVVDDQGATITGAAVRLTRYGASAFFFAEEGPRVADIEAKSGKDGTFLMSNVPAFSQYALVVTHPKFSRMERSPVVVLDGKLTQEPNLVLTPGVGLTGKVTDTGGANVAGATVSLSLSMLASLVGDSAEVVTVRSDADGRYAFLNVAPGNYGLGVVADGYGRVDIQNLNVAGEGSTRDVVLDVAHMIAGTVRSVDGAPLKEVEIQAWSMDNRASQSRSSVRTDEQGQFIIQDVPQGQYRLIAQHPAFDMTDRNLRAETGDMSLQIMMRPFPMVRGQVVASATGLPVTNFTAQLRTPVQGSQTATSAVPDSRQTFVDPEGYFALTARRPMECMVQVTADGFATTTSARFTVPLSGDVNNIVVRMIQGGSMRGRVVDGAGKPVAGARVTSFHNDYVDDMFARAVADSNLWFATEATTMTTADGQFKLGNLMPETYRIVIKHPDYAETVQTGILVTDGGESAVRDILLPKGSKVSGVVYGPNGRPIAGALVTLQGERPFAGSIPGGPYTTRTDEAGQYVLLNVKQGSYGAHASRPQANANNPFQDSIDAAATKVTVTVSDGTELTQDLTFRQ